MERRAEGSGPGRAAESHRGPRRSLRHPPLRESGPDAGREEVDAERADHGEDVRHDRDDPLALKPRGFRRASMHALARKEIDGSPYRKPGGLALAVPWWMPLGAACPPPGLKPR